MNHGIMAKSDLYTILSIIGVLIVFLWLLDFMIKVHKDAEEENKKSDGTI